ncbi:MAG: 3,4-dihydroxy 2-butanone 4-phosphate synthase / cyclohydrolase [Myxococcales bacterium]|jgi:3,4-dihydroxy 2-butanone 4-phosphate synthase/GTP cyclohydrolase II|nr:3,4-dihydroxy 2-butanone 4-phosphate synthase / cyclohydrolase [Myxococcales bacterium]
MASSSGSGPTIGTGGAAAPALGERVRSVQRAIDVIRTGGMVVLVDDEDRENEGDLVMAANLVTPEAINFMARHGRGLICLSLTEERVRQLALPMMSPDNRSPRSTAFTVSIDARRGMTTGISARERAETVRVAVSSQASADDIVTPGHIFPLRARRGGVLVRSGHTEGSVDLARLAGHEPAGVICEIMRDDGEMARMPDLEAFASQHNLPVVTIADLIEYRLSQEILVHRTAESLVRPRLGGINAEFRAYVYTTDVEDTEYLALVLGQPAPDHPVMVRVQSASVLRDVFGVTPDPDGTPATLPLRMIEEEGEGILLYVYPRGRASLLEDFANQTKAVVAQPSSSSSQALASPARETRLRDFGLGAQVLAHLGVRAIRLLTNHPRRIVGVGGYGLHIVECLPIRAAAKVVPLRERENEG